jgi:membrane peptidoglycan carboxypeptidase
MAAGPLAHTSRFEHTLFVGLTRDFVGSFWLGYDLPSPMPGVHGGGEPVQAFAAMTTTGFFPGSAVSAVGGC